MAEDTETLSLSLKLDDQTFTTDDPILTGRQIRSLGNLVPASDFVLLEIANGSSRSIGLDEDVDLRAAESACFVSFRSDRVYSLTVNERGFEWGAEEISAAELRRYGDIPEDHELVLDSKNDRTIPDDGVVRLKPKGVERVLSRPVEKICIIINAREKYVDAGKLSFKELVELAFPGSGNGPDTTHTVTYRKGRGDAPEGTLIVGENVKLKKGMVFNVSETDKS
ncbi:MAG: hypothetical protein COA78_13560 [Blastopirellula sp.]|nr:MAG: hypothetical protein COA78_13560 [Blastopirellula sp.]